MYILQQFYLSPYEEAENFYTQFAKRLARGYEELGLE